MVYQLAACINGHIACLPRERIVSSVNHTVTQPFQVCNPFITMKVMHFMYSALPYKHGEISCAFLLCCRRLHAWLGNVKFKSLNMCRNFQSPSAQMIEALIIYRPTWRKRSKLLLLGPAILLHHHFEYTWELNVSTGNLSLSLKG